MYTKMKVSKIKAKKGKQAHTGMSRHPSFR